MARAVPQNMKARPFVRAHRVHAHRRAIRYGGTGMRYLTVSKTLAVSWAIAAAAACNSSNVGNVNGNGDANGTTDRTAADVKRDEPRPQPISVTGCLQQGSGRTYILTRLNEPAQKEVGTSGSPAAVEREQLRAAANAYRIDP